MVAQVILVEAQPAQVSTGGAVTMRLAGGGGARPFDYSGHSDWRAGIRGLPTMIASLEYRGGEFPAGSVPSAAAIEWQGSSRALLATLSSYLWTDAAITVRVGPEGALPPVLISGKVLAATAEAGKLTLALADPAAAIKKPLLTSRFAGTGGLEGPVEWDGLIRKRVWGRVWNLAGEPIDKANNIYCFADPLRPIQAFDAVRDKGAAAAALTTLAWQGSAAATFTALQTAVAPAGGGVICPSIACVKWWTQPAGELCADLRGEVGAGYVETTAAIAQRLVEAIAGPSFAAGTVSAAAAARPAPVGWLADDDSTTVAAMLDELLGNSSLLWLLDDAGSIVLRQWAWGAPVASAKSEDVSRREVLRPLATRRLGYKRNETQMARGDLAAIVLSSDVNYLDGTPIETLKPADPGATAGADIGVDLRLPTSIPTAAELVTSLGTAAGIAGQGDLAIANRASLAFGENAIVNSDFVRGSYGWFFSAFATDGGINLPGWFGLRNVLWFYKSGALASGDVIDCSQTGWWGTANATFQKNFGVPVKQGDRVYIRALLGQHRCTAQLYLLVYDKDFNLLEAPSWTGALAGGGSNGNPANFNLVGGLHTISNSAAASMQLMIRMLGTSESDPYIFMAEPAMGIVPAGQTVLPPYQPGRSDPIADQTNTNTAAGISGQTAWATYTGDSPSTYTLRVQYLDTSGQLAALDRVVDRRMTLLRRADGTTALTEAMAITSLGVAASVFGQGIGAISNSLADLDPTAASQLTTAYNGGIQTVGYGETLKRRIAAGASLDLSAQVSVNAGGSSSGNIKARIEVSLFGAGSWSTVNTGPGASVTPSEPGLDEVTGTYTNSTGAEQLFEFRVVIVRTPGGAGGTLISAQSFIVG